jgi:hypothetical protein
LKRARVRHRVFVTGVRPDRNGTLSKLQPFAMYAWNLLLSRSRGEDHVAAVAARAPTEPRRRPTTAVK